MTGSNNINRRPQRSPAPVRRAWQRMLSGRRLDLLDPSPFDVEIEDIAHGLARVARWNGQTLGPQAFSVAQHSLVVTEIAVDLAPEWNAGWQLAALLHDAPEYVIGDLISPFKAAIGADYREIERRLLGAIHQRFGLPALLPSHIADTIKRADRFSAYYEATRLAGFERDEAERLFGKPATLSHRLERRLDTLEPLGTARAQAEFLDKFRNLHP